MREQGLGLDAQALYELNPFLPIERLSALFHQVATREGRAFSRQHCRNHPRALILSICSFHILVELCVFRFGQFEVLDQREKK